MPHIRSLISAAQASMRGAFKNRSLLGNGHVDLNKSLTWEKPNIARRAYCSPTQSRWGRAGLACLLLVLLLFSFSSLNARSSSSSSIYYDRPEPRHFHLMVPASQPDANLCKTLVSAAILGYSTPTLVNWNRTFNEPNLIFGGSHIAKIHGVLNHLQNMTKEYDDDLVLVVDGYDVWFQLRPDVLIERYFELNRRANDLLRNSLGQSVVRKQGISQSVVFSSQKRCWPKNENHPSCWAVPESTLPRKVYGAKTDTNFEDDKNPYAKFRQRYLNSGSVVGTVAAVRQVFERAAEILQVDKNIGSDQGIFAQIFGEQEFHRQYVAMQSRNLFSRLGDWVLKNTGREYSYRLVDPDKKGSHQFMRLAEGGRYEYGIGLDYESRILQATVFSEFDTDWVQLRDMSNIRRISNEKNVPGHPRVGSIPTDIRSSAPPFHGLGGEMHSGDSLPTGKSWAEVPLFTNLWTGFSPVAIHHDAHRDGMKRRIETHWNETWYQPFARALLNSRLLLPQGPVAVTKGSGTEQKWYSPIRHTWSNEWSSIYTDDGYELQFEQLCSEHSQELFRDNEGHWTDPRKLSAEVNDVGM